MQEGTKKTPADYLNGLAWDGTPRLERWLIEYAAAADTPQNREAGRRLLVDAARRALHPGCRVDVTVVLCGHQGNGKSTALRVLAGDWFADDLPLDPRERVEATAGAWIVEISHEHFAPTRPDDDEYVPLKDLLSLTHDVVRMPYARESVRVPRAFVTIGTLNFHFPIIDRDGHRFLVVDADRFDAHALRRDRDQLWAEAAAEAKSLHHADAAPSRDPFVVAADAALDALPASAQIFSHLRDSARAAAAAAGARALDGLVDRVIAAVCETHDGSDLWGHAKEDPEAFRRAVRFALGIRS